MNPRKLTLNQFVVCDYAMISKENKLSLVGIFNQVFVRQLPTTYSKIFVVGIVSGKASEVYEVTLKLNEPTGNNIIPEQKLKVTIGINGETNIIAELNNLRFEVAGKYEVELLLQDKTLGKREFSVVLVNPPDKDKLLH